MRTAKDEGVRRGFERWGQVTFGNPPRYFAFEPALLDQRHEERAGHAAYAHLGPLPVDQFPVAVAVHRGGGAEQQHVLELLQAQHLRHPGRHHADEWGFGPLRLETLERQRGHGVAGCHHALHLALEQKGGVFEGKLHDCVLRLAAVRHPRRVAQVDQMLAGKLPPQRRGHGQPAQAGVENADWPVIVLHRNTPHRPMTRMRTARISTTTRDAVRRLNPARRRRRFRLTWVIAASTVGAAGVRRVFSTSSLNHPNMPYLSTRSK